MYNEIVDELLITVYPEHIDQFFTKDDGFYIRTKQCTEVLLFELTESLTHDEFKSICTIIAAKLAIKGVHGGNCNMTSCQKPPAMYYNKSTTMYYCKACADEINWPGGRADTQRLYGTPLLCEFVPLDKPITPSLCELSDVPFTE